MTNEELDAACSQYGGLKPEYWKAGIKGQSMCIVEPEWFRKDYEANPGKYWTKDAIPEWPKCSTDWAATGRLMDALKVKGVCAYCIPTSNASQRWIGFAGGFLDPLESCKREFADSGPRALCLAVAALAEASGKEAGR